MNKLILFLIGENTKGIVVKIFENPIAKKTFLLLSVSFLLICGSLLLTTYTLYKYYDPIQRPLRYIQVEKGEINDLRTLSYPQQSRESLENWVSSAVRDLNSLSFNTLDEAINSHRRYFVDDASFNIYKKSLEDSGKLKTIKKDSIKITTVLLKTPVQISVRESGENIYWTYRVPVLINYNSGSIKPFSEKRTVEVMLVRVPSYKNHAGFGIVRLS